MHFIVIIWNVLYIFTIQLNDKMMKSRKPERPNKRITMNPKSVKGLISLLKRLEKISPSDLLGYHKLTTVEKDKINAIMAELSNTVNEYDPTKIYDLPPRNQVP